MNIVCYFIITLYNVYCKRLSLLLKTVLAQIYFIPGFWVLLKPREQKILLFTFFICVLPFSFHFEAASFDFFTLTVITPFTKSGEKLMKPPVHLLPPPQSAFS
jgi:hypothetical protein